MIRVEHIRLPIDHSKADLRNAILKKLLLDPDMLVDFAIARRSVDARKKKHILFNYTVEVNVTDLEKVLELNRDNRHIGPVPHTAWTFPQGPFHTEKRPVIVGAGPCGLFAGLALAEAGLAPLLIERGKPATARVKDVHRFWDTGEFDPASNALFGEGGAGTFSDGKLTTRIKDRHNRCRKVLRWLVEAGAPEEILWQQNPHLGTDRLVSLVAAIRRKIVERGGEVRFESRAAELVIDGGAIQGVTLENGEEIGARQVILAIGHSARDTMAMLHACGVAMAPKPFSIGVRIEHPQEQIDRCQFGPQAGHPALGHADYKLVHHCANGRSVYTFCMCPGGEVIAANSEPGQVVTNGMSVWNRNRPNANSALLAGITPADFESDHPLAGIAFQRHWERLAFDCGGGGYFAPAQSVGDFLAGRASTAFGDITPTYRPGVTPADLRDCLPAFAAAALREAIPAMARKLRNFDRPDAVLTGVETRSSSPLRILRDETGMSLNTIGLYPAGEGAGYAGGIMSSAADGLRVAEAVAGALEKKDPNR
jgi:uncharacterized protein